VATLAAYTYSGLSNLLGTRRTRKIGNNTVAERITDNTLVVTLHGHPIVELTESGVVSFTLAGYPTVTTRDRINSLLPAGFRLYQRDWEQYLSTRRGEIIHVGSTGWITCDDVSGDASLGALA
jgi:hypothetical protein